MEAFTTFNGIGIPIDIPNCDTDQIIPARLLRQVRTDPGYDRFLFHDLRFADDGTEKPDFIFNKAPFRDGRVIVANINWGCGSSRENSVYALVANAGTFSFKSVGSFELKGINGMQPIYEVLWR